MAGYSFHKTDEGNVVCTRLNTSEETRGMFAANLPGNGFRVSGVTNDWNLSAQVVPDYDFFEYFDASDGYYYRVYMSEMQAVNTPVHKLPKRHTGWPTRTREQAMAEITARENAAVEMAVAQAVELKEGKSQFAIEKSLLRKRHEAMIAEANLIAEEIAKFVVANGDRKTRITTRLNDEGLSDFVDDVLENNPVVGNPAVKTPVVDPFADPVAEQVNNPITQPLVQQTTTNSFTI